MLSPKRFGIVTLLYLDGPMTISDIRRALNLTWGDTSTQVRALARAGYVETRRVLTRRGERVYVRLTECGVRAYVEVVSALRRLLSALPPKAAEQALEKFGIVVPKEEKVAVEEGEFPEYGLVREDRFRRLLEER